MCIRDRCIYYDHIAPERMSRRLNNDNTVFQAEMYALAEAPIFIKRYMAEYKRHIKNDRKVIILCGSQAGIKALISPHIKCSTTKLVFGRLSALAEEGIEIIIRWIKAHNDYRGNEIADNMAKEGAAKDSVEVDLPPSRAANKQVITDYICLLYTSPSPRDKRQSRMPSSA